MALDVTIAPTAGNPVLLTDGGAGASPGYSALDWRRIIHASTAFQEGVLDPGGWKVTEKAGGTNMSVDVAADGGAATVLGDSDPNQGLYVVAPHTTAANLGAISGNSSGNPRLDYVVLQVRDDTHDGSGEFDARARYLEGAATSGATHDNPVGAPTVPDTAILLAQVLVPDGTTTAVTNSMIRDRRPWARGINARSLVTGAVNIGSTGWQLIDSDARMRLEFSGAPVVVTMNMVARNGGANAGLLAGLAVSAAAGNLPSGFVAAGESTSPTIVSHFQVATDTNQGLDGTRVIVPQAGSFLVEPQVFLSSAGWVEDASQLHLRELPVSLANNGTA